ncbi:MAG: hypothetical protein JOZ69_24345, partial [Myxococcales bacterium]|nr:hypothetical protein [Myxococcales bacterium]
GQELQLAGCETDIAQPGLTPATPGGLVSTNAATSLATFGFLNLPSSINGGAVYCEDFDEQLLCGNDGGANVNACATSQGLLQPSTFSFNTTCGNGVREPLEDCDCGDGVSTSTDPQCTAAGANGAKNGAAPNICSVICRLN